MTPDPLDVIRLHFVFLMQDSEDLLYPLTVGQQLDKLSMFLFEVLPDNSHERRAILTIRYPNPFDIFQDRDADNPAYCWTWNGPLNEHGYPTAPGAFTLHRELYRFIPVYGPVLVEHQLHHTCENKRCINPNHIQPLTDKQHRAAHGRTDDESWASPNY